MSKDWELHELRHRAGYLDKKRLAQLCGVTERTVENWEKVGPPTAVKTLLQVLAKDLEWMGQEWAGFRLYNGELLGPNGEWITPGMIRAFPHMERALELQRLAMLDEHRAQARAQAAPSPLAKVKAWLKR
jgi:DNA-binding XRE family transcriptional regulator